MVRIKNMSEIEKMSIEKSRAYAEKLLEEKPDFSDPEKVKAFLDGEMTNIPLGFEPREYSRERVWEIQKQFNLRREQNIIFYKDKVEEELSYEGLHSTFQKFAQVELRPMYDYNVIDQDADVRIAAAIWILDRLWENGTFELAIELFPDITGNIDAYYLPSEVRHPCYSNDLINSLVHLLTYRHGNPASILCEENINQEEVSMDYQKLMKLLPHDAIIAAENAFKTKQWELLERIMKIQAFAEEKLAESTRKLWQMLDQQKVLLNNFTHDDIDKVSAEGEELNKIARELNIHLNEYLHMSRAELWTKFEYREIVDALSHFQVEDSFEICFALIELIEKQDAAPWLLCSGGHLCQYAAQMLPWTVSSVYRDEEGNLRREDPRSYNFNGWAQREKQTDSFDYYHTFFRKVNMAQLIYSQCGCIVPVGKHPLDKERKMLINSGLDETIANKTIGMAETLFLFNYQVDLPRTKELVIKEDSFVEETNIEPDYLVDDIHDLEEQLQKAREEAKVEIEKAKREIRVLKEALVKERKTAESRYAEYEQELKTLRMEHRELADLRDLVFNQENAIQEKSKEIYTFPHEVRKRTIVFGGHESFLRAIKPMLPNVRFIDAGQMSFSTDLIRNSDVVWVQTNCMSHSQFGNIAKTARQYRVQMRYFSYSSAEKCAEQLVNEDMK